MPGPVVTETQVERRMEMYKQGLTDREIADQVGMAQESVSYWRRRNGLPRNAARWDSQRMSLYNQGMTDREIGRQTGQRATTICNWRAARKLPANRGTHTNLTISVPMT
jgi:transcriptional regulator